MDDSDRTLIIPPGKRTPHYRTLEKNTDCSRSADPWRICFVFYRNQAFEYSVHCPILSICGHCSAQIGDAQTEATIFALKEKNNGEALHLTQAALKQFPNSPMTF
jgi:hypothetical protein